MWEGLVLCWEIFQRDDVSPMLSSLFDSLRLGWAWDILIAGASWDTEHQAGQCSLKIKTFILSIFKCPYLSWIRLLALSTNHSIMQLSSFDTKIGLTTQKNSKFYPHLAKDAKLIYHDLSWDIVDWCQTRLWEKKRNFKSPGASWVSPHWCLESVLKLKYEKILPRPLVRLAKPMLVDGPGIQSWNYFRQAFREA